MQVADTLRIDADDSATGELIVQHDIRFPRPPLTANDARHIIDRLRHNPRIDTLTIWGYDIHNVAVLNVFRNGLPLCTSITTVKLINTPLGNEGLERLIPAFYNTSVTSLDLYNNNIQGQHGGEVIRDLLVGNYSLLKLDLGGNPIGQEGADGIGKGLAENNNRLQTLNLFDCRIGIVGLANWSAAADGMINNSLTNLDLAGNFIEGAEGGRQLTLLLQRFRALKVLKLNGNNRLGPSGAHELAPGIAAASHLEVLELFNCELGNDGVANLIPDGQVNRSLTDFLIGGNDMLGDVGVETVMALAARCTNLDRLVAHPMSLYPYRRLNLLLERKRLHTEAHTLGSSPPAVVFEKLLQANCHEHGLSASFVILRNYIFAEQHKSCSSCKRKIQATGVKRKR